MAVTCREILGLDICKRLKLLGGAGGLDNEISWPYIKNVDTITEWIHGGELIFVVGSREDISEKGLLGLMKEAVDVHVSGVVFLIGEEYIRAVPKSVVRVGDENNIPVFRMPFALKLIDVTQEISRLILEDSKITRAKESEDGESALVLLLEGKTKEELLDYCNKRLAPLLEADRIFKTEYVHTLKSYIKYNNDLLHTSQQIYIHRNTMINRMKKITALLGENVNEPKVRNDFQNIFQILDYYDTKQE